MSEPVLRQLADEPSSERRTQILDAAKRRFARAGFHRTTMQDVADEAGMSPGNLYRYFTSKDALVAGICGRDRAELGREFAEIRDGTDNFMAGFRALGNRHFGEEGGEKARLCLEIWAEATRNPVIAALQTEFDRSLIEQFAEIFEAAKKRGSVHPSVNSRAAASVITKLGDGLFVRKATAADFDPERELNEVFAVVRALLDGTIKMPGPASTPESKS